MNSCKKLMIPRGTLYNCARKRMGLCKHTVFVEAKIPCGTMTYSGKANYSKSMTFASEIFFNSLSATCQDLPQHKNVKIHSSATQIHIQIMVYSVP